MKYFNLSVLICSVTNYVPNIINICKNCDSKILPN